jgi:hypothetical protein
MENGFQANLTLNMDIFNQIKVGTVVRVRWDKTSLYTGTVLEPLPVKGKAKKFVVLFAGGSDAELRIAPTPNGKGIYEIVSGGATTTGNGSIKSGTSSSSSSSSYSYSFSSSSSSTSKVKTKKKKTPPAKTKPRNKKQSSASTQDTTEYYTDRRGRRRKTSNQQPSTNNQHRHYPIHMSCPSESTHATHEPLKRNYRRASTDIENRLTRPSILGCSINYFWVVHPEKPGNTWIEGTVGKQTTPDGLYRITFPKRAGLVNVLMVPLRNPKYHCLWYRTHDHPALGSLVQRSGGRQLTTVDNITWVQCTCTGCDNWVALPLGLHHVAACTSLPPACSIDSIYLFHFRLLYDIHSI